MVFPYGCCPSSGILSLLKPTICGQSLGSELVIILFYFTIVLIPNVTHNKSKKILNVVRVTKMIGKNNADDKKWHSSFLAGCF
jgi:hypothetical protein